MKRLSLTATLVLVLVASACNSGSDASGPSSFDPAAAATKLDRLAGLAITGSGKDAAGRSGPIAGRIQGEKADVGFPYSTTATLANIRVRRVGPQAWIRRTTTSKPIGLGPPILVLAQSGRPLWIAIKFDHPLIGGIYDPYDPAILLRALADGGAKFKSAPQATVGGTARRGFVTTPAVKLARAIGARSVTVWVDGSGLPVRIKVATTNGVTANYDIHATKGRIAVTAPGAAQIEVPQAAPKPEGAFVEVAAGTAGAAPYRILRAPGTDGWECWKVESTPAYQPASEPGASGALCTPNIATDGDPLDQVSFPIDALAASGYEMIGFVVPPGTTGEVILADGVTRKPMTVDQKGFALFTGPLDEIAGIAILNLPGNVKLYCGPGPVQTPQDLPPEKLQFGGTSGDSLRDLPWNCLPADSLDG